MDSPSAKLVATDFSDYTDFNARLEGAYLSFKARIDCSDEFCAPCKFSNEIVALASVKSMAPSSSATCPSVPCINLFNL